MSRDKQLLAVGKRYLCLRGSTIDRKLDPERQLIDPIFLSGFLRTILSPQPMIFVLLLGSFAQEFSLGPSVNTLQLCWGPHGLPNQFLLVAVSDQMLYRLLFCRLFLFSFTPA